MEVEKFEKDQVNSDEELALSSQSGDESAQNELFHRYKNFVRVKARSYFLIGADHEDIIQEGMIGLYKAIRDFKLGKQSSFRSFAELCVTRQMITAIKTATRQKHIPLNSYVSLNKPVYEDDTERTLIDMLSMRRMSSPEDLLIGLESYHDIQKQVKEILSSFEYLVFKHYLDGKSYQEIARYLSKPTKAIDNALQRVKRKLEKSLIMD